MSSTRQVNYFLVDCNQFYVSCEQVFNPKLRGKPVVILSNNDGCIVARSKEAKALKIPMGAPFYQYADLCKKEKVFVGSSNYTLYGDLSQRVMQVLSAFTSEMEEYSIDEAFLKLEAKNANVIAREIQSKVLQWTGIPVSIGVGLTKTLAKVANDISKNDASSQGIFTFTDKRQIDEVLEKLSVKEIWGIGTQLSTRLLAEGIDNARTFKDSPDQWIKDRFSITVLRIAWELRGISCYSFRDLPIERKSITRSRSFGKPTSAWDDLAEALSSYTADALENLRAEHLLPSFFTVFLMTSPFCPRPYSNCCTQTLIEPSHYTPAVITLAKQSLRKIYRSGYRYTKVGIMLGGLTPEGHYQPDLFHQSKTDRGKQTKAMQVYDQINHRFGNKVMCFAAEGIKQPWKMQRSAVSPRFTTDWDELLMIRI